MSKESKKCTNLMGKGLRIYGWLLISVTPLWFLYESDEVGPTQITAALIVLILAISSWLLWAKSRISQSRSKQVVIPLVVALFSVGITSLIVSSLLADLILGVVAGLLVLSGGQMTLYAARSSY